MDYANPRQQRLSEGLPSRIHSGRILEQFRQDLSEGPPRPWRGGVSPRSGVRAERKRSGSGPTADLDKKLKNWGRVRRSARSGGRSNRRRGCRGERRSARSDGRSGAAQRTPKALRSETARGHQISQNGEARTGADLSAIDCREASREVLRRDAPKGMPGGAEKRARSEGATLKFQAPERSDRGGAGRRLGCETTLAELRAYSVDRPGARVVESRFSVIFGGDSAEGSWGRKTAKTQPFGAKTVVKTPSVLLHRRQLALGTRSARP